MSIKKKGFVCLILILFLGCTNGKTEVDMGVTGDLSAIDGHTIILDNGLAWAIEHNNTSSLQPLYKETKSIRERTRSLRVRFKEIIQERDKFKEELDKEEKLIWVDLIYRLAPVVLGVLVLLIGRFLTQDPADTKFGIVCFLSGIAINAFYDTIGNWGIIAMIAVAFGYLVYSHEKKDLVKKSLATTLSES